VRPTGATTRRDYPAKLRRIKFYDAPNDRTFVFLTNHFELPAATIAALYAKRWCPIITDDMLWTMFRAA
jgi:hypothetical protein